MTEGKTVDQKVVKEASERYESGGVPTEVVKQVNVARTNMEESEGKNPPANATDQFKRTT